MQTTLKKHLPEETIFRSLPGLARFIAEEKEKEFILELISQAEHCGLPMLQHLNHLPESELYDLGRNYFGNMLSQLAGNRADEYIQEVSAMWIGDRLPHMGSGDVSAEDIYLFSYIRKQAFLKFIPAYTDDIPEILNLIREIDAFNLKLEQMSTRNYVSLLHKRIHDNASFTEGITRSTPGIIYVFDIINKKQIYINKSVRGLMEISPGVLHSLEKNEIRTHIHPDDKPKLEDYDREFATIQDNEVKTIQFRFLEEDGSFRWVRAYESVFKRDATGAVLQKSGILVDITDEVNKSDELQRKEELYKQAQSLTHIGNYTWNLATEQISWSDEMYRIYEMQPQSVPIDPDMLRAYNHPDDAALIRKQIQDAVEGGTGFDFRYRIVLEDGATKVLHARGEIVRDTVTGKAVQIVGTAEDITETHNLITRLKRADEMYKQAEKLAHIGNWKWNFINDQIEWTDEMYRIYGLEPQSEQITLEKFRSFIHPDDQQMVDEGIRDAFNNRFQDYTYRIVTAKSEVKTIRSIAQVHFDEEGNPLFAYGTEQDVTEREELITKLRESETLYKEAQALAHLGNWTWEIKNDKVHWSDEMYRIFEVEPGQTINLQRYLDILHPDDRNRVRQIVERAVQYCENYEFNHRILLPDGRIKVIFSRGEIKYNEEGKVTGIMGTAQDVTRIQELVEKLENSEKYYKQAQALAHIGNWSIEAESGKMEWTEELYRIYGLSPSIGTVSQALFLEKVHPDDRETVQRFIEETFRTGKPFEIYHRICLDDCEKTLHIRGEAQTDEDGAVIQIFGTTQDVTEQQLTEKELRNSRNFIQKVADATPSVITSYNAITGEYSFVSGGLKKLLGFDPEEPLRQGVQFFINLIHPDDLDNLNKKNSAALEFANSTEGRNQDDVLVEFQYRMRNNKGEYRWIHTYGTVFDRKPDGTVENVLNISLDITDRMMAQEKIREQEHFIKNIADASPTILYLYNLRDSRIEYINEEINFVTGYSPEEIFSMGNNFRNDMYHPDDIPMLPEKNDGYADLSSEKESMFQYECRMKAKNGSWRWLMVREIIYTRSGNGTPELVLGAALDFTERREMELALQQKNFELQQSNTNLEEFAYVASHDLQEPLRKISVFGDKLIESKSNLREEQLVYLEKMIGSSTRMQHLIDDLLIISRISHDKTFELFSLKDILNNTLQLLEHSIEEKNAVIHSTELPSVMINPGQFRQLFQNLVNNSLKFVEPGTQPVINISHQYISPAEVEHLSLAKSDRYLKIVFEDNGIGFGNEYAQKIFIIFQRLHGKSEYAGTGIGLAICKKIMENHGGAIYASGEPGKGAVFTVVVPV